MDSVIMTSPGNSTRLKSRLRNAATTFLARNSKNRQANKNYTINHKNNRNPTSRTNSLRNNVNLKQSNSFNNSNIIGNHDNNRISTTVNNCNSNNTKQTEVSHRGPFAREVYNAICSRLGQTPYIPGDSVQKLFNDMHLHPSKSQVLEMLQCARQCARRNGTAPFLTLGEFCVFARELQKPKSHRKTLQQRANNKCTKKCEVFLGGSCNPTTWRTDIAIPELQKHGITYYNPQKPIWGPELVAEEHEAKQSASVLFFVVDSQTRSVSGMIEVAYLVASNRCVVIVAHPYTLGQSIMGEELLYKEYIDLVDGQSSLLALVKSQGVKVYNNLTAALQRTTHLLENLSTNGNLLEEQVTNKLRLLKDTFDFYDVNRSGELLINDVLDAYYRLTNKTLQIGELYQYLSTSKNSDIKKIRISFEQFCTLVAEFSSEGSNNSISDGRIFNSLFWTSTLLKTRHLFRVFVARPITALDWSSQPSQLQTTTNNNANCDISNTNCSIINNSINSETWFADVYLGGSCKTQSTWRENIAIPLLKKHGLTYYNPAVRETDSVDSLNQDLTNGSMYFNGENDACENGESTVFENRVLHKKCIDKSKILLFVVTNDTRSLTSMILAAHYIGLDSTRVVLCVEQLPPDNCTIGNEKLTKQAIKDYNRGRVYLSDVAQRKQTPVFENITDAVQYVIEKCQNR